MSVKLPNITKIQSSSPASPQLQHTEGHLQPAPEPQEEYPQYQNHDDFQQLQEPHPHPAPQTLTVLKAKSDPQHEQLQVEVVPKKDCSDTERQNQKQKGEGLEQILSQKLKTAADLRQSIDDKKKEIKSIGQQIDKDLNKSLLKASKTNTVNIRDIFSAAPKTNNQNVNQLNSELKQTRFAIKKIKNDIQKAQQGFQDPLALLNKDRGQQFKNKIKDTDTELKSIEHEKQMLEQQISRGGKQLNQEEEKQKSEEISKVSHELHEISNSLKEQKLKIYHLQKEDIVLMQKIKFFQQREGHLGVKKSKLTQKDKQKMEQEIKQLISEINETIDERNKTQNEKRQQVKQLSQEISSLEAKNWQLYNKLRQVDAFLLQYYEKKTRRKEGKNLEKTIDVIDKSPSGNIEYSSIVSDHLYKSKVSNKNDKNIVENEAPLVEKKKNYEFGLKQSQKHEVNLNDDFLGQKLNIKKLTFKCTKTKILYIHAKYTNNIGMQVDGLVMGAKDIQEDVQTLELILKKEEVINLIHTGFQEDQCLSYFHIVTSEGKQIKWGSLQKVAKNEQKHIKKYESSFIKSKFIFDDKQEVFSPQLAGFTLLTTYMTPK